MHCISPDAREPSKALSEVRPRREDPHVALLQRAAAQGIVEDLVDLAVHQDGAPAGTGSSRASHRGEAQPHEADPPQHEV
eukprot:16357517-Heterocapsa_arctica.AAC.1